MCRNTNWECCLIFRGIRMMWKSKCALLTDENQRSNKMFKCFSRKTLSYELIITIVFPIPRISKGQLLCDFSKFGTYSELGSVAHCARNLGTCIHRTRGKRYTTRRILHVCDTCFLFFWSLSKIKWAWKETEKVLLRAHEPENKSQNARFVREIGHEPLSYAR